MFKKIFNAVTYPFHLVFCFGVIIAAMFAYAFDKELQRELDDFNGIREGE